jgi:hypothetical protein
MQITVKLTAAAIGIAAIAGCANPGPTTTTTTVTRDSAGNPIAGGSVTRDANGNVISSSPGVYPSTPYRGY